MRNALLVFQKNPELGKVKTRLAASVGDEAALAIYVRLIKHTKHIIDLLNTDKQIWYSNMVDNDDIWDKSRYQKYVQKGTGLGEKMSNAFESALSNIGTTKAVIIGTDCAEITTEIIDKAFQSLDSHDFVIGPANDGGYYLLGMNTIFPEVFKNIEWSTSNVFSATRNRIVALGKSVYVLQKLSDVDTIDDWNKAKELVE